jgi:molecular chaperone DnaK
LGEDSDLIRSQTEAVATASMKLGEAVYKASQENASSAEASNPSDSNESTSSDGPVVDADFEDLSKK